MADLVLKQVHKAFGAITVIPSVDLNIQNGEFVVFVGPSGCGKSTLLRLIAGLESATSGDILIDGESVVRQAAADRGVAMVFQSYALYPHMSVRQNLSFGLENIRMNKDEITQRVNNAASILHIESLLDRKPKQLSGGQRQRVAIGRAITRDPKIFLFDEPLSNLDAELRVVMRFEIKRLHERLKNTMIYVTHDQVEAMTMADKIVVLRSGVVEQVGAPLTLYNHPDNKFVAGFIGSPAMNFFDGEITATDNQYLQIKTDDGSQLRLLHQGLAIQQGQKVCLGIRPENFAFAEADDHGISIKVEYAEQHGSNTYVHGTLGNQQTVLIHRPGQFEVTVGDVMKLVPQVGKWHLFDENEQTIRH